MAGQTPLYLLQEVNIKSISWKEPILYLVIKIVNHRIWKEGLGQTNPYTGSLEARV
jgi:hypothetical protein